MSNRVRQRPLNTQTRHAIRRAARCPDCNSWVTVHADLVDVEHDPTCPRHAELRRRNATTQFLLIRNAN